MEEENTTTKQESGTLYSNSSNNNNNNNNTTEPDRVLLPGRPNLGQCDNRVRSARYTAWSFFPMVRLFVCFFCFVCLLFCFVCYFCGERIMYILKSFFAFHVDYYYKVCCRSSNMMMMMIPDDRRSPHLFGSLVPPPPPPLCHIYMENTNKRTQTHAYTNKQPKLYSIYIYKGNIETIPTFCQFILSCGWNDYGNWTLFPLFI